MSNYQLINTETRLLELCSQFSDNHEIALDTEFKRETSYYPIPCLIQIKANDAIALIDPLSIQDLTPLNDLLKNSNHCKILHSGRQDLEVFQILLNAFPEPLFDTQIAAALLGKATQIGYSALVQDYFNVELDKSLTRTDWSKRPLSEKELLYAANDVEYLIPIYKSQTEELNKQNRLHWLNEEIEFLFNETKQDDSLEKVWKKISRSQHFSTEQRNILYALNQWREKEAKKRNRARQFVVSNECMVNIALAKPQTPAALSEIDKLPASVVRRYADDLLTLINSKETQQLEIREETHNRLSPEEMHIAKKLKTIIKATAEELQIEDTILCNRKTLETTARGNLETRLFKGWRLEVIGAHLMDVIRSS